MHGSVNIAAQTDSTPYQRNTTFTNRCDSYPAIGNQHVPARLPREGDN